MDIGAAAGIYTKLMLKNNPTSRVVAFEPFVGNHTHFLRTVGSDPRVTLHQKAVSYRPGEVPFYVSSVVSGSEPGWESYKGYSSLGFIVNSFEPRDGFSLTAVPSATLDSMIFERVRFCKIDVQGGEFNVLRGSRKLIRDHGMDVIFLEFGGEEGVLEFLAEEGFIIFDNIYLLVATRNKPDELEWCLRRPLAISTGKPAFNAWPLRAPREFESYMLWLKEQTRAIGGVWTDLVCVRKKFIPHFLQAVANYHQSLD